MNNTSLMFVLVMATLIVESTLNKIDDSGEHHHQGLLARGKRQASRRSCGGAPNLPANTQITSRVRSSYNAGDVITYKCTPGFMRLVQGSLSVTCKADGTWSELPLCQSYTYSCRRDKLARMYRGEVNRTRCGRPCQKWSVESPQRITGSVRRDMQNPQLFPEYRNVFDAQNYCRNPDSSESAGPWCYVNERGRPRWGYCDVSYCDGDDLMGDYDKVPGACGCDSEWYMAALNYGNIRSLSGTTLDRCKEACDAEARCQGFVMDENQNKCWLKKCSCRDSEVECTEWKHETYYRKKQVICPGAEFVDRWDRRHCYFSLFNLNINTSLTYDWQTSRQLCQDLFPLKSDIASFQSEAQWTFITSSAFARLAIPRRYPRAWIGLNRPEQTADAWSWIGDSFSNRNFVPPLNYTRWATNEPSNGYEEQCSQVILTPENSEPKEDIGRWKTESCFRRAPVICKAEMTRFTWDD